MERLVEERVGFREARAARRGQALWQTLHPVPVWGHAEQVRKAPYLPSREPARKLSTPQGWQGSNHFVGYPLACIVVFRGSDPTVVVGDVEPELVEVVVDQPRYELASRVPRDQSP